MVSTYCYADVEESDDTIFLLLQHANVLPCIAAEGLSLTLCFAQYSLIT